MQDAAQASGQELALVLEPEPEPEPELEQEQEPAGGEEPGLAATFQPC
jgi:hypothetical protein